MAYSSYQDRWTVHTRTLDEEKGRAIDSPRDPALWIAMDGDGRRLYIPEAGKTYRNRILQTPFGGGESVEACAACMFPWDASPSGRYLLTMGEGEVSTMGLAKLPAQHETPYLVHPEWGLYRGRFSPGEGWILFYARTAPDRSRIMAARFDPERPPPPAEWIALSGDESFHGPAGWSAAEDRIYYASYRDGYRCIWTQAVDATSKQPRGDARAVVHFHDAARSLKNVPRGMFGFSVSGNTIAYELGELSGKIHSTRIR